MIHPIFTAGYSGHSPTELLRAVETQRATVLDVRFKPQSRVPGWSEGELSHLLGSRYYHVQELGNPGAFDGGGMRLQNERAGIQILAGFVKQSPVILLCGCSQFENCHRALISRKLTQYNITTQELAWPILAPEDGSIPCISLWQPWAQLMALGLKRIETRGWDTLLRGPLAIHAAKRWTGEEFEFLECTEEAAEPLKEAGYTWSSNPLKTNLPLGAVVAVVNLSGCQRSEVLSPIVTPLERAFGNYAPNRFGWLTDSVRKLEMPVPTRGAQRIFTVPFPDELKVPT